MSSSENEIQIEEMLERARRRKLNAEGLRRRPLHGPSLHSYVEDEDEDWDEEGEEKNLIQETEKEQLLMEPKSDSSWLSFVVIAFIVCFCCVLAYFMINRQYKHIKTNVLDPELLAQYRVGIAPYQEQFPSQSSELWINVFAGIMHTSTSNRLSVFLILHDDTTNTSCLAQALGRVSAMLLGNSSSTQPLIVSASNLHQSDTIRQDLINRRAVVVEELQHMPVGENQKLLLHGLADTENPIAPGIAVVFTLRVQEGNTSSALKTAEMELNRAWNWIDSESRLPLIVRVTGGFVYKMANEMNVTYC